MTTTFRTFMYREKTVKDRNIPEDLPVKKINMDDVVINYRTPYYSNSKFRYGDTRIKETANLPETEFEIINDEYFFPRRVRKASTATSLYKENEVWFLNPPKDVAVFFVGLKDGKITTVYYIEFEEEPGDLLEDTFSKNDYNFYGFTSKEFTALPELSPDKVMWLSDFIYPKLNYTKRDLKYFNLLTLFSKMMALKAEIIQIAELLDIDIKVFLDWEKNAVKGMPWRSKPTGLMMQDISPAKLHTLNIKADFDRVKEKSSAISEGYVIPIFLLSIFNAVFNT